MLADNPSENETNSQDAAFETWLSAQLRNQWSRGSSETDLPEAMAEPPFAGRQLSPDGRETSGRANGHDNSETAST
jgi:hypothetical protein